MSTSVHYVVTVAVKKVTKTVPDKSYSNRDDGPTRDVEDVTNFSTTRPTLRSAAHLVIQHLGVLVQGDPKWDTEGVDN